MAIGGTSILEEAARARLAKEILDIQDHIVALKSGPMQGAQIANIGDLQSELEADYLKLYKMHGTELLARPDQIKAGLIKAHELEEAEHFACQILASGSDTLRFPATSAEAKKLHQMLLEAKQALLARRILELQGHIEVLRKDGFDEEAPEIKSLKTPLDECYKALYELGGAELLARSDLINARLKAVPLDRPIAEVLHAGNMSTAKLWAASILDNQFDLGRSPHKPPKNTIVDLAYQVISGKITTAAQFDAYLGDHPETDGEGNPTKASGLRSSLGRMEAGDYVYKTVQGPFTFGMSRHL